MINISDIKYKLAAFAPDGTAFDLTDVSSNLTWGESEKELACKIKFKVPFNSDTQYLQPLTPIIIYADVGEGFSECVRGQVQKMQFTERNETCSLEIEAADECIALRQNQNDLYVTDGHTSSAILEKILEGYDATRIEVQDEKHSKKVYRGRYLADMIADVLQDLKESDKGVYFVRAKEGTIEIIQRGTNETIYSFSINDNVVSVSETFDASKTVTKVQVVAKDKAEGHPKIESAIEDHTELGTRQRIYYRSSKETLEDAEKAAKKLLEENSIKRETRLECADLPFLRKGDRIRLTNSLGEAYFFVKDINHNAAQSKMTLSLTYDNERNEELGLNYWLAWTDESTSD